MSEFKVGDDVIISFWFQSRSSNGFRRCNSKMKKFVGERATITEVSPFVDGEAYKLDIDGGRWMWDVVGLTLVEEESMDNFKVGDIIVKADGDSWCASGGAKEAKVYKVDGDAVHVEITHDVTGERVISNFPSWSKNFKIKQNPNPPHKHRDLIIAWANGADIEYYSTFSNRWMGASAPDWDTTLNYRTKPQEPQKTEAQLEKEAIQKEMEILAKRLEGLEV